MKKWETVKSNIAFNEILNKGKKVANNYFLLFSLEKEEEKPKFAVAVGKKIGNAVVRNKFKRRTRALIDKNRKLFENNYNYIIMIRKECLGKSFSDLEDHFIDLLRKDRNEKKH